MSNDRNLILEMHCEYLEKEIADLIAKHEKELDDVLDQLMENISAKRITEGLGTAVAFNEGIKKALIEVDSITRRIINARIGGKQNEY